MKNVFLILFLLFVSASVKAQDPGLTSYDELLQLVQKAKTTYELEKLNEIRLRLRQIEFDRLEDKNQKELYAEAYRQLALSHRYNKYIRPGYELYQKYITLKDTLLKMEFRQQIDSAVRDMEKEIIKANRDLDSIKNVQSELSEKFNSLQNLRANFMSYCTIITIILAALFFFFYSSVSRKIRDSKASVQENRNKIQEIYDEHTRCRMFAGVVTQMIVLNNRIKEHHEGLKTSFSSVQETFKDLKETESLIKQFKDDEGRLEKLIEINNKILQPFISS
jgi:hypothetical protein